MIWSFVCIQMILQRIIISRWLYWIPDWIIKYILNCANCCWSFFFDMVACISIVQKNLTLIIFLNLCLRVRKMQNQKKKKKNTTIWDCVFRIKRAISQCSLSDAINKWRNCAWLGNLRRAVLARWVTARRKII